MDNTSEENTNIEQTSELEIEETSHTEESELTTEQLQEKENFLNLRENKITCREYLIEKRLPAELIDIINTDNFEEFKEKVDKVTRLFNLRQVAPLASTEPCDYSDDLKKAFSEPKHNPKLFGFLGRN